MRKNEILEVIIVSSPEEEYYDGIRIAVELIKPENGMLCIRPCYYMKRIRRDGKFYWCLIPRPLNISPKKANRIIKAINELSTKYFRIYESIIIDTEISRSI